MQNKSFFLLCAVLLTYTVVGGIIFYHLESPAEKAAAITASKDHQDFLEKHPTVKEKDLTEYVSKVITAYDEGYPPTYLNISPKWTIQNGIFFAATLITTVGYGKLAPSTSAGHAVCILYALIGIPLSLILLSEIGCRLKSVLQQVDEKLECCSSGMRMARLFRSCILVKVGFIFYIFIPAALFSAIEGWPYITSVYYAVITLSTVGFGDYIAGCGSSYPSWQAVYQLAVFIWIIIGLSWFATIVVSVKDIWATELHQIENKERTEDLEKEQGEKTALK